MARVSVPSVLTKKILHHEEKLVYQLLQPYIDRDTNQNPFLIFSMFL